MEDLLIERISDSRKNRKAKALYRKTGVLML